MCTVSVVFDYGRSMRPEWWNPEKFREFKALLESAKEFDKKTGQPDCEDVKKSEWMKSVEERLNKLEGK